MAVLVAKGVITKNEVLDMLTELHRRNPRAAAPQDSLAVDPHKIDVLIRHILRFQLNRPDRAASQRRARASSGRCGDCTSRLGIRLRLTVRDTLTKLLGSTNLEYQVVS